MSLSSTQLTVGFAITNGEYGPTDAALSNLESMDATSGDGTTITFLSDNFSPVTGQPAGYANPASYDMAQIYETMFGAVPTGQQLTAWSNQLISGSVTPGEAVTDFIGSDITAAHFGQSSDLVPDALATKSVIDQLILQNTGVAATSAQETAWETQTNSAMFGAFASGDQMTARSAPHIADFLDALVTHDIVGTGSAPSGDLFSF